MKHPRKPKAIGSRGSLHAPPTNAFKPGNKGGGRPPLTDEARKAREMLRAASPAAVQALTESLKSDSEDVRLKAAQAILAKVFPHGIDISVSGPDGDTVELVLDPAKLTTEQLTAVLAALPTPSSGD